ncbi:MAG: rhomboid family intramembrane serine protease [Candidatus Acidiferrum sp.]
MALPYQWQMRAERLKRMFGGMFGKGERRPQLCPACGALVGISATRCHVCGANLRFGLAAWSKGLSEFFGGHAPVTTALLILNVIVFAAEIMGTMHAGKMGGLSILWGMDGETLYRLGACYGPAIFVGHEWYRLVTAMFLHGGLIHIGFNMIVLLDIGPMVEEVYGSARYLFLYLVMGIAGYVLSALAGHFSVGASGAILGIIGLLIAITTKRGGTQMKELRSRLISWVVTIFALGFLVGGLRTDNWAHFGGLAAGFLLGKVFADRLPEPGRERTQAYALGWLAGVVIIASFALMVLHYSDAIPG